MTNNLTEVGLALRAKRLRFQAERLAVHEYVRLQRNDSTEEICLLCAVPTRERDRVLLVFKTNFLGKTEFFTGILYLTEKAADAAELLGAWYREVRSNAKSYWVNADWGSWPLEAVQQTVRSHGIADSMLPAFGLSNAN
ncbi:hypothetical protein LPN04_31550 [Rugamonas sp. A1-17]|nr:hypothetical protein [Rugamonas sp. A1-17]